MRLALEKSKAWGKFYQVLSKSVQAKILHGICIAMLIVGSWGPGSLLLDGWTWCCLTMNPPQCAFTPRRKWRKDGCRLDVIGSLVGSLLGLLIWYLVSFCFVFPRSGRWGHLFVLVVVGFEVWRERRLDIFIMENARILEITAIVKGRESSLGDHRKIKCSEGSLMCLYTC